MGNRTQQGQTVNTQAPYFKKKVEGAVKDAKGLYRQGLGFNPFPGKWYVDESGATDNALRKMAKIAKGGHKLGKQSTGFVGDLVGGAYNPDVSSYRALLGNTNNETFQGVIDTQAGKLGDDITRQFGGSAFGSAAHSGTIADQVGEFRNKMASDNWHRNNMMQRGLLGDITGVEQMGVQNQMAGLSAAPGAYDFQYAPWERLAGVGAAREGYDAAKLEGKMNKFTAKDMADLNRLGWYSGQIGGGGNYGTTTSQVSNAGNPWGGAAAGALGGLRTGAAIGMPLLGAGLGGIAGLLGG
ncbi:MAG: hypothetical protein GY798_34890 [Hyphomicrobiales bacterium]|nr:hypothetical protein [Hyphomicrobiales bacterium]